jgi:class 3 adenylate cyclase
MARLTPQQLGERIGDRTEKTAVRSRICCRQLFTEASAGRFSHIRRVLSGNQPAEHARQVVSFALDSLDSVNDLNQELGERLQMRVGVNTGGLIIAGVRGAIEVKGGIVVTYLVSERMSGR